MCRPTASQLVLCFKGAGPCAPVGPVGLCSAAVDSAIVGLTAVDSTAVDSATIQTAAIDSAAAGSIAPAYHLCVCDVALAVSSAVGSTAVGFSIIRSTVVT